jgi:arylsulfatase
MKKLKCIIKYSLLGAMLVAPIFCSALAAAEKPNIIIIMTDDMGYSDLGCYGGEIETPNLDMLANKGVRFTQFYNAGRCCPTRASLLTGLYQHQAGIGGMMGDRGEKWPGFRGYLTERCVTFAEVLKTAGYNTYQTGKWHVGDKKKEWWPLARGFDHSYSCPQGGGFFFKPSSFKEKRQVVRDTEVLYDQKNDPPADWYATDAWTDEGLKFIESEAKENRPFIWYLAHNAPHFPLQTKPQDIAKYRGKFMQGWDKLREQRHKRLIDLGIIDKEWELSPREKGIPAWDSLSDKEKDQQDLRMASYAAMIDCVDQNVGKIITKLKELNQYDNTLILFLHDNGACDAGGTMGENTGKGTCGTAESFAYYGACWANVSNTPFRKYKKYIHEGGISTPLIAHWPEGIAKKLQGKLITEPAHVIDIMASCVDLSGATYPTRFKGHEIIPMEGSSLRPLFEGKSLERNDGLFFEHYGHRGVRRGSWKLVATRQGKWELYDMLSDRTELNDLASKMPEKVNELSRLYNKWTERCLVQKLKGE